MGRLTGPGHMAQWFEAVFTTGVKVLVEKRGGRLYENRDVGCHPTIDARSTGENDKNS